MTVVRMRRLLRLALIVAMPLLLLGAIHLIAQQLTTTLPPDLIRITQARVLDSRAVDPRQVPGAILAQAPVASAASAASTPWPASLAPEVVTLPVQVNDTEAPGPLWFTMDFRLAAAATQPYWLVIQHRPAASLYLDGQVLAHSSSGNGFAAEDEDDFAQRGLLLAGRRLQVGIPPALLGAGEHRLSIRLSRPGFEGAGLSAPLLGPAIQMRALQEGRRFWQILRIGTALAGIVIGLFMLMVWLALRQEWLYGVTGLFCLFTALLLSPYLLNGALLPAPWWRVTLDMADLLSKALLLYLVGRLFGTPSVHASRWPRRWPNRLVGVYLALAIPIDGYAAYSGWSWTDFSHPWPWWALGSRAVVLTAAAVLAARAALSTGRASHLVGACAVGFSGWVWAYVSWFALIVSQQLTVVDINVFGHAALIAIAGVALQRRFVGSLLAQAQSRGLLERALAERTRELQTRWEELQVSEHQRSAAQERERLLQEMHDGLGSQLVTARLCAERGVPSETLVNQLDECIREMRLTVDALAVTDGDLTLLLANLRHRMGPRLADAGLELDWQLSDVPLLPTLRGTGGRELIRIVQESLSNIIHHAGASRVRFTTRMEADGCAVSLSIIDNGRGLPEVLRHGNGLRSMRKRAERISADIQWRAPEDTIHEGGTEMLLRLPLTAPP